MNTPAAGGVETAMLDLKLVLPVLAVVTGSAIVVATRPSDPVVLPVASGPAPSPAIAAGAAGAADAGEGVVAWDTRLVSATGSAPADRTGTTVAQARLSGERAAKVAVYRKLLRAIGALRTSTGARVDEVVDERTLAMAAETYRIVDTKYFSDGSVDVAATLPLELIDSFVAPATVVP